MVVANGAVVASWGDVDRRFKCHSVRKSFLSALYGIYWDRGALELNKTLADLGLDDDPHPLLETEKRARILDLLKARSGVFHPAAYAGRTDSRPRGSEDGFMWWVFREPRFARHGMFSALGVGNQMIASNSIFNRTARSTKKTATSVTYRSEMKRALSWESRTQLPWPKPPW